MSRQVVSSAVCLVTVLLGGGCVGARFVEVTPEGGVVAVPSNSNSWPTYFRQNAEELMQKQCPEGYVIDHEQEVVVGQHTTENAVGNMKTVENWDRHEWRIYFRRKGVPTARQAAPAESPPAEVPSQ